MNSPDPTQRILWMLWGCTAAMTAVFMFFALSSPDAGLRTPHLEQAWWQALLLWAYVAAPVIAQFLLLPAFRRRGLLLPTVCLFLSAGVSIPNSFFPPAFVAGALLGMRLKLWALPIAFGVQVAGMVLGMAVGQPPREWTAWWTALPSLLPSLLFNATGVLLGVLLTGQQELAEARVAQARSQERAHLSREMHDSLAQRLSLISLHAAALGIRRDLDAEQVADTADTVRTMAAEAGRELRQILHVLHDDGSGDQTVVAWEDITRAVQRQRDAGLDVHLDVGQEWARAFDEADATSRHAVLRTVEEALSNARRHGSGGSAGLSFTVTGTTLVVDCVNPSARRARPRPGQGLGLPGLRERMRLLGGQLLFGSDAGRFTLRAELPARREFAHD